MTGILISGIPVFLQNGSSIKSHPMIAWDSVKNPPCSLGNVLLYGWKIRSINCPNGSGLPQETVKRIFALSCYYFGTQNRLPKQPPFASSHVIERGSKIPVKYLIGPFCYSNG